MDLTVHVNGSREGILPNTGVEKSILDDHTPHILFPIWDFVWEDHIHIGHHHTPYIASQPTPGRKILQLLLSPVSRSLSPVGEVQPRRKDRGVCKGRGHRHHVLQSRHRGKNRRMPSEQQVDAPIIDTSSEEGLEHLENVKASPGDAPKTLQKTQLEVQMWI